MVIERLQVILTQLTANRSRVHLVEMIALLALFHKLIRGTLLCKKMHTWTEVFSIANRSSIAVLSTWPAGMLARFPVSCLGFATGDDD